MQNEFTEKWTKLTQCASKPIIDMTELNMSTWNRIAKNASVLESLSQSKKPEDMLAAQAKMTNAVYLELTAYSQKAMEIGLQALSEANRIWVDAFNETACKTNDFVKSAAPKRK